MNANQDRFAGDEFAQFQHHRFFGHIADLALEAVDSEVAEPGRELRLRNLAEFGGRAFWHGLFLLIWGLETLTSL